MWAVLLDGPWVRVPTDSSYILDGRRNWADSVTTNELLAILNDDASRLGAQPVDARMVRFWIDKRLIEARIPRGRRRGLSPIWHFSEPAVRHARLILQLKSRGVHRASSLRIHLWILADDYPKKGV